MSLLPNRDAFITAVQEGRLATAAFGPSDDVGLMIDAIRAAVDCVGIGPNEITIRPHPSYDRHLHVEAKR